MAKSHTESSAISSSVTQSAVRNRNPTSKTNDTRADDDSSPSSSPPVEKPESLPKKLKKLVTFQPVSFNSLDYLLIISITIFSVFFRTYRLAHPNEVVFDEVHFGKFAGKYINRTYFFDLHPPLAKMMFALAGKLSGYDGVFAFEKIGQDYIANNVSYFGMRLLSALMGALIVPASYVTIRAFGFSILSSILASFMVCFENGLITQSRLILLDSIMVFFTVYSVMFYSLFRNAQNSPYSFSWWSWLFLTGFNMGCALSSKWIALFLVAFIGICTILDLWEMIADLDVSPEKYSKQFASRAICLIAVPLTVYIMSFIAHFIVLHKIETPDNGFTTEFNKSFDGADQVSSMKHIYFGSAIRIKHASTSSGYLHSHNHSWTEEKSSKQQQITIYSYPDENNLFKIIPAYNVTLNSTVVPLKNGDIIRLKHIQTGKNLHSHDVKAPVSKDDNKFELSGYGADNFDGDSNDNFRVEVISSANKKNSKGELEIEAINTKFRLIHVNMNCALFNTRKKLPKYAFEQFEVVCMRSCTPRMSTWQIEYAEFSSDENPELINNEKTSYKKLSMWEKIVEYNIRMINVNNELVDDHPYASRPQKWPFLIRGTAYWGGKGSVIYQLGNPLVWWLSSASVFMFILVAGINHLYFKRTQSVLFESFDNYQVGLLVVGYCTHYLPFYLIGRELFLHHYFAALWFSIMVFCGLLDSCISFYNKNILKNSSISKLVRPIAITVLMLAIFYSFVVFYPITFGSTFTKSQCQSMKWLKSWDIDCSHAI
ncbi:Dolichyl-phosphate-mannose-protein mannosyltransferase 1 [Smittium culicis]|uniref:Dolichyl-phosphate-mannose--protein mannosyltransferase n=1 Tax=Smittium culicis TaxID=133412 RepID=A0A1R1XDE0_9FUNG|nr:Dolichyl-phosphate-mannose-protein mannosyltransferase 1 [Smittium culicis]